MGIDSHQATNTYLSPSLSFQRHGFGKYNLAYTFEDTNRQATFLALLVKLIDCAVQLTLCWERALLAESHHTRIVLLR